MGAQGVDVVEDTEFFDPNLQEDDDSFGDFDNTDDFVAGEDVDLGDDLDQDGVPDSFDTDDDNDGTPDNQDTDDHWHPDSGAAANDPAKYRPFQTAGPETARARLDS
jgi:hypothetical protein